MNAVFEKVSLPELFQNRKTEWIIIPLLLFLSQPLKVHAQGINFGSYHAYEITLENISMGDLQFEEPILANSGIHTVELVDAYVLQIIGVKYLDAGMTISGNGFLYLDGNEGAAENERIPFTLKAAYANRGNNNVTDAIPITVSAGFGEARFPIRARQGQPPGPPPRPPTGNFNQETVNENAYLYLYGEIDVGDVVAGFYTGNITINVQYDDPPAVPD